MTSVESCSVRNAWKRERPMIQGVQTVGIFFHNTSRIAEVRVLDVKPKSLLSTNHIGKRDIQALPVKCDKDCTWQGIVATIEEHRARCKLNAPKSA